MDSDNEKVQEENASAKGKKTLYLVLAIAAFVIGLWFIINILIKMFSGAVVIGAALDIVTGVILIAFGALFLMKSIRLKDKA